MEGIRTIELPDPIRACLFDLDGVLTDTGETKEFAQFVQIVAPLLLPT